MEQRNKRQRLGAQAWRGILERFGYSGLTVEAFCRGESISSQSFYRWRARLGAPADTGTAPKDVSARDALAGRFVDLGTLHGSQVSSLRMELKLDLGGGLMLHLVRG